MVFVHVVEPQGIVRGMCIFWRNYHHVLLVKYDDFFIEVGICDGLKNEHWTVFLIYASMDDKKRKEQWRLLSQRVALAGDKCLLIGNFNDITDDSETEGGNYRSVASRRNFCDFIVGNGLLDLGFMGYLFTWRNRRDEGTIKQLLDQGLAKSGWLNVYPEAKIMHEVLEGFDHTIHILDTKPLPFLRKKRLIYDPRWNNVE